MHEGSHILLRPHPAPRPTNAFTVLRATLNMGIRARHTLPKPSTGSSGNAETQIPNTLPTAFLSWAPLLILGSQPLLITKL